MDQDIVANYIHLIARKEIEEIQKQIGDLTKDIVLLDVQRYQDPSLIPQLCRKKLKRERLQESYKDKLSIYKDICSRLSIKPKVL